MLKEKPLNAKQIADSLGIDYKSVRRHLELLVDNKVVVTAGEKYGMAYFVSPELEADFEYFMTVWNEVEGRRKG